MDSGTEYRSRAQTDTFVPLWGTVQSSHSSPNHGKSDEVTHPPVAYEPGDADRPGARASERSLIQRCRCSVPRRDKHHSAARVYVPAKPITRPVDARTMGAATLPPCRASLWIHCSRSVRSYISQCKDFTHMWTLPNHVHSVPRT